MPSVDVASRIDDYQALKPTSGVRGSVVTLPLIDSDSGGACTGLLVRIISTSDRPEFGPLGRIVDWRLPERMMAQDLPGRRSQP
jgi:hypothetical protein